MYIAAEFSFFSKINDSHIIKRESLFHSFNSCRLISAVIKIMQNKHHTMHSKYYKVKRDSKNFTASTLPLVWTVSNASL